MRSLLTDNITSRFKNEYLELLKEEIYTPYFLSYGTILQFLKKDPKEEKKLSVLDIMNTFAKEKCSQSKYYFKVEFKSKEKNVTKKDFLSKSAGFGFATPKRNLSFSGFETENI